MNLETSAKLRAQFPPEHVGKLPRVTCGDCRDSRQRVCDKHKKSRCDGCQSYITSAHMHLDFVGHADTTDRLLDADPEWTWEPFALDSRGLPALDEYGGMWIRLTVAGTTRIGYGDADGKKGGNAVKETIGDAIRNASMRFGVALDLWRKETHVDESRPAQTRRREAPTPEQVAEKARAAIKSAKTVHDVENLRVLVDERFADGQLTETDHQSLVEYTHVRESEIRAADITAPVDERQHKRMAVLWRELGLGGDEKRGERLARTSEIVGRDVTTSKDLSHAEAVQVIKTLVAEVEPKAAS